MKFTCTYTQTEKLLQRYQFYTKTGLPKWMWLGIVLIIGSVIMFIQTRDEIDLLFLVLGLAMGVKEVITPFRNAKKEYDALLGKYGAEIPETTVTVDTEKAVSTFDGQETTLLLEDVLGIYVCKDFLVLRGFEKDVLLVGLPDIQEAKEFLDKHCINAPVYKR